MWQQQTNLKATELSFGRILTRDEGVQYNVTSTIQHKCQRTVQTVPGKVKLASEDLQKG